MRRKFQGVGNIIRFNWHFYVIATIVVVVIGVVTPFLPVGIQFWSYFFAFGIVLSTLISLAVSYYIYDVSELYLLSYLPDNQRFNTVVNINAGFDETSFILAKKYPDAQLCALDFYDATKHTEVSIERARQAYPPYPNTKIISTDHIPIPDESADLILLFMAAHEIREETERIVFFAEIKRILHREGKIVVVEHQRDVMNFLAFNIGFFHFYSKKSWLEVFLKAKLDLITEKKITPFVSVFILK